MTDDSQTENTSIRSTRLEKISYLRKKGYPLYPSRFDRTHLASAIAQKFQSLQKGEETEEIVAVAGRIMSIRNSGMFIDLHDHTGKVQVFCHEKALDADTLSLVASLDLGDIIGVVGKVRCTQRGEITVDASTVILLTKILLPLPEKYHGLTDVEQRYRKRYLDLIMNSETRDTLRKRSLITASIRDHLNQQAFLEVETPMLHPIPGGAIARPFVTHHNTFDLDLYLRIAPELYLKKLIIGGLSDKVFEMNRCFRNEGISTRHNPEFTTIEIYQAFANDDIMMTLTEDIVRAACLCVNDGLVIPYGDKSIDLTGPWARKPMSSLVKEQTGVDFMDLKTDAEARQAGTKLGIKVTDKMGWGKVLESLFAEKVEHLLVQPTHVTEFPVEISPLAKVNPNDPRLTERFETYMNGWEIANGFSELNDPIDQRARFEDQVKERDSGDNEAHHMDEDFLTSLEYALPPTGGMGMGIDRLVMILTNAPSIRDVIAFPTLRPKLG